MACNLYYISTARRYITIPSAMDKCIFWLCEYSTVWPPSDALIITSRYLPPPSDTQKSSIHPHQQVSGTEIEACCILSVQSQTQKSFLSQASQLESCTLLRIRHDIVLSTGETHESMSPCGNLLLLVFDCALGMLFCLPMLLLTKYAFCLLSWHNFVHASILHMHSRVIRTWKITWPVCSYLTPPPLNLNCTPLSVKSTYPLVNVIYPPSQCNVYPLSM